jgi:hypothetical protein
MPNVYVWKSHFHLYAYVQTSRDDSCVRVLYVHVMLVEVT